MAKRDGNRSPKFKNGNRIERHDANCISGLDHDDYEKVNEEESENTLGKTETNPNDDSFTWQEETTKKMNTN